MFKRVVKLFVVCVSLLNVGQAQAATYQTVVQCKTQDAYTAKSFKIVKANNGYYGLFMNKAVASPTLKTQFVRFKCQLAEDNRKGTLTTNFRCLELSNLNHTNNGPIYKAVITSGGFVWMPQARIYKDFPAPSGPSKGVSMLCEWAS